MNRVGVSSASIVVITCGPTACSKRQRHDGRQRSWDSAQGAISAVARPSEVEVANRRPEASGLRLDSEEELNSLRVLDQNLSRSGSPFIALVAR